MDFHVSRIELIETTDEEVVDVDIINIYLSEMKQD